MDYDVERAFERIENELISSMFRNFKNHRAEETEYGFNWEAWQALQLRALDDYKRKNKKQFMREFTDINSHIDEFIRQARADGNAAQEIEILEAIRRGYKAKASGGAEIAADFIKLNDRKMDALINATVSDMKRAETAMLRMTNDRYRKIIFDAQVYSASGAGSYEKAVDMAMKDFLRAGINCVEYKNGARHTTRDYVSMVLATTGKRAYLTGEGEMRKRWGESLVIMNKRGNPCPLCAKFVGRVLIDDVWSGGKPDGRYMLMSRAISEGLYHPRCKDGHTTYFEGISDEGVPYTAEEREALAKEYNAGQKRSYAENQAEKYARMAAFALDIGNKRQYEKRAQEWREIAGNSVDKSKKSGIMRVGSDNVALENQRYGRNKNTLVNKTYIESGEYKRKFDTATDNSDVNKTLYDCAKTALKHRSGTAFEDMYWIDSDTGKVIHSVVDSTDERAIIYTEKIKSVVRNNHGLITLHTHPSSLPPSASDINSCFKNKYKTGFVACHNGRIFGYTSNEIINERIYNIYIQNYINEGLGEFDAQLKALEKLSQSIDIQIWEVG